ncbi:hypothetical protein HPB52_001281 [Rhipicephalus sanguineus]|uniref:Uncharacterized protein n=1 Tax=Rhipicephalus sanguineus TaxID=34632 RepID=A0A9D4PTL4_RHISA|nr:hypothetical protein HPB52_001281 [Rhipicephalus sanguineus]
MFDATLALNGVTAQPLMQAVLLNPLPAELRHLDAALTSSPQPYDDLCAAVLACYGHTYRPLRWNCEFQNFPPSQSVVSAGPQPSLDHNDTSLIMTTSTSVAATAASIPELDHHNNTGDASTSTHLSNTRCIPSKLLAKVSSRVPAICTPSPTSTARDTAVTSDSMMVTMPHAL